MELLLQHMFEDEIKREDDEDRQTFAMMDSDEEDLEEDDVAGADLYYRNERIEETNEEQADKGENTAAPAMTSAPSTEESTVQASTV